MTKIAIIQRPPVLLDRGATLAKAVQWVAEAAAAGATLIVFPESFIPGYPSWIWRLAAGRDGAVMGPLHARLLANAVDVGGGDLAELCEAARAHQVTLVGSLICWENYMPLARYALDAQGVEIYVAPTYDSGDAWLATMRHIALEGRCWVIGSGTALRAADIPQDFPARAALFPEAEDWINDGDSVVVDPTGKVVVGPLRREAGVLYAEIDVARVAPSRRTLDVAGHYARADIFELHVHRAPVIPVRFADG